MGAEKIMPAGTARRQGMTCTYTYLQIYNPQQGYRGAGRDPAEGRLGPHCARGGPGWCGVRVGGVAGLQQGELCAAGPSTLPYVLAPEPLPSQHDLLQLLAPLNPKPKTPNP